MEINQFEPPVLLNIQVTEKLPKQIPISIMLQAGQEKKEPGQPGPDAGSILIQKIEPSKLTLIVSTGLVSKTNPESFRIAGGSAAKWLMENKASKAAFILSSLDNCGVDQALEYFCEGLWLGSYQFIKYKTQEKLQACKLYLEVGNQVKAIQARLEPVQLVTHAVNMARQITHEPAAVVNPLTLSKLAEAVATKYHLTVNVLEQDSLKRMKAGALLAVGQGSKTPARLIVLEYPGSGEMTTEKPVVLVGKAVTFDTGGYSLKDADHIIGMKFDKSGGVIVLCTLMAASMLKLKQPVIGIIPTVENMVSEKAYLPDDIITSMSGKTIEVISTDAEGRLILCDALTYAQKNYQPKSLIDLATLTGGVITALGHVRAGLISNHKTLRLQLTECGEAVHERLWPLPLDDDYFELIKSHEADIKNVCVSREASTIVGAMFLKQFIQDDTCWAHIDIAGTAEVDKDHPYCPKGPSGFGVRLLIDYLKKLEE